MKPSISSKCGPTSLLLTIAFLIFFPDSANSSEDFQYFHSDINYWGRSRSEKVEGQKPVSENPSKPVLTPAQEKFSWQKYLDPNNKEFFKEGDYTPPEPFMEIVRNPSDANLKLWFAYMDRKNELSSRLQTRMQEYAAQNGPKLGTAGQAYLNTRAINLPKADHDIKRYRFRMYFDSHCPHCKRMFGTLRELQEKGYFVEARQVDNDPEGMRNITIPVAKASPSEIQEKSIQNVPLLLVGDLLKKTVYRMSGYQSVTSIFQAIAQGGATN